MHELATELPEALSLVFTTVLDILVVIGSLIIAYYFLTIIYKIFYEVYRFLKIKNDNMMK